MRHLDIARAIGRQTSIMKIWPTPKDFELPEDAEYYAAIFLFDHKGCEYVEICDDIADPNNEPIILIPLVEIGRPDCYQIIYRDKKYIGITIRIWPDSWGHEKFKKYAEPLIKKSYRAFFQLQVMRDFHAELYNRVFSEAITRRRCNSQEEGVQPSRHNTAASNQSPT